MSKRLALILCMIATAGVAQTPTTGNIRGVVLRWGTNDPIPQATIELRSTTGAAAPVSITASRQDGGFMFSGIPSGTYRILAMADGFAMSEYGQLRQGGRGRPITVGGGETADAQISMAPGGIISGKITDQNGQPTVYSEVQIQRASYNPNGQLVPVLTLSVYANDLGEYRAFWLPPGPYIVSAGTSQLNSFVNQGTTNPLNSDNSIPTTFITQSNRPKARAAPETSAEQNSIPSPDPQIFFGGALEAKSAQVVNVRPGAEASGIDIRVAASLPVRRNRITGVVLDASGQPLQGAFGISISSWPMGQSGAFSSISFLTARVPMTDPADIARGAMRYVVDNGKFEGTASAGSYQIRASQGDLAGRVLIDVSSQDLNVTIPLLPLMTIIGRVRLENAAANTSIDFSKLQVGLLTAPSNAFLSPSAMPDGSFRIERVIPGDFQILVPPLIPSPVNSPAPTGDRPPIPAGLENAYVKSIHLGVADVTNDLIRIDSASSIGTLDVVIGLNGASVEGRVMNAEKSIVEHATVVLLPQAEPPFRADRYRTMTTEKSGQFQFRGLPPGDYRLLAWEDIDSGAWFNPAFVATFEKSAVPVHLIEGQRQNDLEIAIIPVGQ
jgi:hypothetical protein